MTPLQEALAEALHESNLMARYAGYALQANPLTMTVAPSDELARDWAAALLASPALANLAALVEAAEKWRDGWRAYENAEGWVPSADPLMAAVDAFRGSR